MVNYNVRMKLSPKGNPAQTWVGGYSVHASDPTAAENRALEFAEQNKEDVHKIVNVRELT